MDHATFVNAPVPVDLDGESYYVSALTLKEWGPVQAWIKTNVPGPMRAISSADLVNLSDEDKRIVLESAAMAQRNWPPQIGSISWFKALDHPGGHAEFLFCSLSKHQARFTREDAATLSDRLEIKDVMPIVLACLGLEQDDLKVVSATGPQKEQGNRETISVRSRSGSRKPSTGRTSKSKH